MKRVAAVFGTALFCCANLAGGSARAAENSGPIVQTDAGALAGSVETKAGAPISVFKGVPFAAPPVGELRWREPQPVAAWSGVRDATKFGPSPMQRVHGDFLPWTREFLVQNEVSEDCLYLNIWTPGVKEEAAAASHAGAAGDVRAKLSLVDAGAKLPVLVYVPGGAFVEGSGEVPIYDGANLATRGVVVVTINYRLGVFGFFAHPALTAESPHHASGNYGLMDQIAALRWVQKNIAAFGGDPSRVTVWGQSAGAFSVGALLASPEAKGLFQRAMADSGLSLAAFPMKELRMAEQDGVKYAAKQHAADLKALRALPAAQLLATNMGSPIVDGWILPQSTNAINTARGGSDVPVLTGYQANDAQLSLRGINSAADYATYLKSQYGAQADEFGKLYPAESVAAMRRAALEGARDRQRVGMFLWAKRRGQGYTSPVYIYFFLRAIPWPQHPEFGAFHSGELPYFFRNLDVLDRPWEPIDRQLSDVASGYLVNFAATGNPNGRGEREQAAVVNNRGKDKSSSSNASRSRFVAGDNVSLPNWAAVDASAPAIFEIGESQKSAPLVDDAKLAFWTRYFDSREGAKAPPF
ncbi:MAG TPA: carboxylesterase family protein [Opitutaceae bacterium]|nr:carboxylesterase family protein [Opitutaceae bacterium]